MANQSTSLWASLGQIALAAVASYGAAKLSNSETSWSAYRNSMVQNMAATALTAAIQQYTAVAAANAETASTGTEQTA